MKRSPLYLIASLILVLSFTLASCAPAAVPTTAATQVPAEEAAQPAATQPAAQAETITVIFPKHEADLNGAFEAIGYLPASTFKIPNSIIALETGVVEDDSTLFEWKGEKRRLQVWEQDLIFRDAFQYSCVPCYQEIARKVGVERMKAYLTRLNYGSMVVDSATIDLFWLEGESTITMNQQLDFLKRFYDSELPISERTHEIMERLLLIESNETWSFSGKTGWAIRNGNNIGWFVGYLEKGNNIYFVVTNIEPQEAFNMDLFPKIRTQISLGAFRKLKIIE